MKRIFIIFYNFFYWKIFKQFIESRFFLFFTNRNFFFEKNLPWLILLSKFKAFRFLFPFINDVFNFYVLKDKKIEIRVFNFKYKYLGFFFPFNFAPQMYWGGRVFNFLGGSFLRYLFYNLRYVFRIVRNPKSDLLKLIKKDGVIVYKQLLSASQIEKVDSFYNKNFEDAIYYFEDFSELLIQNTHGCVEKDNEEYKSILNVIKNETIVYDIASKLTGYKKDDLVNPYISILHFKSFPNLNDQIDGQNTPHIDVFYPSFKIFVYINDVNEKNGSFCYLKGSHCFSLKNMFKYYSNCFNHYFIKNKKGLIKPTNALGSKNTSNWISANGVAGDSIIFNVQGIHKRGEFEKSCYRERKVLLIDFRQSEALIKSLLLNI